MSDSGGSSLRESGLVEAVEPTTGTIYDSYESLFNACQEHSRKSGFGVVKRTIRNNKYALIACDRSRFGLTLTKSKRIGCNARVNAKKRDDGSWIISKTITDHNHELEVGHQRPHPGEDQGTVPSTRLGAAERVSGLMRNVDPAGGNVTPRRERENSSSGPVDLPSRRSAPCIQTAIGAAEGRCLHDTSMLSQSEGMGANGNITTLIDQALKILMSADIKTTHEYRNLEVARAQVRVAEEKVEALAVEVKDSHDRLIKKVFDLISAREKKEKAEIADLKRRVTELESRLGSSSDHEAEKTASGINISYILAVVDVAKLVKKQAPDVDLDFLKADLKAYIACYPPPQGVVLDFGVLGNMDE